MASESLDTSTLPVHPIGSHIYLGSTMLNHIGSACPLIGRIAGSIDKDT